MNGKTVAEKVFSRASHGKTSAGDYVWATPDLVHLHDRAAPLALDSFQKMGVSEIRYPGKLVFVVDHIFPPKDIESADNILVMKRFAAERGIEFLEGKGIEHTLLVEKCLIKPGMLVVGADSHTVTAGAVGAVGVGLGSTDLATIMALGRNWFMVPHSMRVSVKGDNKGKYVTGKDVILAVIKQIGVDGANYMAMEIGGEAMRLFGIDDRFAIANMTVEAGAKAGMIEADDIMFSYYERRGFDVREGVAIADKDARYVNHIEIQMDNLKPQVAAPDSPGNVHDVSELKGIKIDQAYIGNCANGTLEDLKQASEVLKGRTVKEGVKLVVVPATREILETALSMGIIAELVRAGATICPSTCAACAGLHLGVLGKGEVALSNTNRNFRGRMGHPESKIYLANSYLVAAAALEGRIIDPEESL
jgi:3-isopropylmalate/(R)-2-methylmalate dehydratase large subunit